MKLREQTLRKLIRQELKSIMEGKSLDDLLKDANRIKKELADANREYSKSKTETNAAKVEAKKGQLLRVSNAIRNARANQVKNESVNEGRRWDDFKDSKHGKILISKLDKSFFGSQTRIELYLDNLLKSMDDDKFLRILDRIMRDLGIDARKYNNKPVYKSYEVIIKTLYKMYEDNELSESINEDVWTSAQKKQVEKLDDEFRNLLAKKGIEPYSSTASKMWKSAGFQKNFQQIFQKDESVNEANVVGKAVFDDGKGKLAFGYYKDDDEVALVDYKTWKKLNFKDVSKGDTNKDRLVKAILRKQKQFNKKVEYNMWSKKTNPSFEEKMDWFIKNGWISNVTKGGIKESIREAKDKPTSKVKRNGSWWRLTVDWPNGDISIKDYKSEKAAKGAEKEFHKLHKTGKIRDDYAFNHSGYLDFSPNDYKWSIAVKMPRAGMTRKEYFDSLSDALKWGKKNIHNFDRDQVEAPIRK